MRLSKGDISGFKFLFALAIMFGLMTMLVHPVLYMKFVKPLGIDAPLDRFSEARAVQHIRVLSKDIDGRQVSLKHFDTNKIYIFFPFQFLVFIINLCLYWF